MERKWNQESKKGKDTMQKIRIHSFTQQLLVNITILSNQIFKRTDCFLFPSFLQELEDSELAKKLKTTFHTAFSWSLFFGSSFWSRNFTLVTSSGAKSSAIPYSSCLTAKNRETFKKAIRSNSKHHN